MAGILQGLDGPSPVQAKSDLAGRASRKKKQRMHAGEPKERKIDFENESDINLESDPLKSKYPRSRPAPRKVPTTALSGDGRLERPAPKRKDYLTMHPSSAGNGRTTTPGPDTLGQIANPNAPGKERPAPGRRRRRRYVDRSY